MPRTIKENHIEFIEAAEEMFPQVASTRQITRQQVLEVHEQYDVRPSTWLTNSADYRVDRGVYHLPKADGSDNPADPRFKSAVGVAQTISSKKHDTLVDRAEQATENDPEVSAGLATIAISASQPEGFYIPDKLIGYKSFGCHRDVHRIVKAGRFFPVFITGLSGNGKTTTIEQVCADLKREFFRCNITAETDESDLLGGFRLADGNTVFEYGPVINAMLRGGVLLLDEIDLASSKIMALQPVLEGKPVFLKKINQWIRPAPGFTVFATANTKGKGDMDSGQFIGTNVLNEAFLDRFPITFEQDYPTMKEEGKILRAKLTDALGVKFEKDDYVSEFVDVLLTFGNESRKAFRSGACEEVITTRRLLNILEYYYILGMVDTPNSRNKAVEACLSRFDGDTKKAFIDLFRNLSKPVTQDEDATSEDSNKTEAGSNNEDPYATAPF